MIQIISILPHLTSFFQRYLSPVGLARFLPKRKPHRFLSSLRTRVGPYLASTSLPGAPRSTSLQRVDSALTAFFGPVIAGPSFPRSLGFHSSIFLLKRADCLYLTLLWKEATLLIAVGSSRLSELRFVVALGEKPELAKLPSPRDVLPLLSPLSSSRFQSAFLPLGLFASPPPLFPD